MAKCPHPDCNGKEIQKNPPPYRDTLTEILNKRVEVCRFERDDPNHKDQWDLSDVISDSTIIKRAKEANIAEDKIREMLNQNSKTAELLRRFFYKPPIKQNYTEKMAAAYIEKHANVTKFCNLPKSGTDSKHVKNGKVISNEENEKLNEPQNLDPLNRSAAKSIDFEFIYGKYHVYASQKYTHEGGGGQNDFQRELGTFLDEAKNPTNTTDLFLAIADGAYNTEGKYWEELGDKKQSFVMGIEVLPHFLKEHFN